MPIGSFFVNRAIVNRHRSARKLSAHLPTLSDTTLKKQRPSGKSAVKAPTASRQLAFHQLLVAARKTWLMDALGEALANMDPSRIKNEITSFVPEDAQRILAAAGIRDEHVFPTPIILETKPTLLGYYRLLLGVPQKSFYRSETGMSRFRSMERRGVLNESQKEILPPFAEPSAKV